MNMCVFYTHIHTHTSYTSTYISTYTYIESALKLPSGLHPGFVLPLLWLPWSMALGSLSWQLLWPDKLLLCNLWFYLFFCVLRVLSSYLCVAVIKHSDRKQCRGKDLFPLILPAHNLLLKKPRQEMKQKPRVGVPLTGSSTSPASTGAPKTPDSPENWDSKAGSAEALLHLSTWGVGGGGRSGAALPVGHYGPNQKEVPLRFGSHICIS